MDRCTSGHTNKNPRKQHSSQIGKAGKEEPQMGPIRSKKGPAEWTRGAKTQKQASQKAKGGKGGCDLGGRGKEEVGYV